MLKTTRKDGVRPHGRAADTQERQLDRTLVPTHVDVEVDVVLRIEKQGTLRT